MSEKSTSPVDTPPATEPTNKPKNIFKSFAEESLGILSGKRRGFSRRGALGGGLTAVAALLTGAGTRALYEPAASIIDLAELTPGALHQFGSLKHSSAKKQIQAISPDYPMRAVERNPGWQSLQNILQQAVRQAQTGEDKVSSLVWKSPEFTPLKKNSDKLPNFGNNFDLNAYLASLPEATQKFIIWSRSTSKIGSLSYIEAPTETFLSNLVSQTSIRDAVARLQTELGGPKPDNEELKSRVLTLEQPVIKHFSDVRNLVEATAERSRLPASPAVVIAHYLKLNNGDLFAALHDSTVFFKATARNGFTSGQYIRESTLENLDWTRKNLKDTSYFANWQDMPTTFEENYANPNYDNLRVINQMGTLYHLLNGLVLSGLIPWSVAAAGHLHTVQNHGDLKIAREAVGVSELAEAMKFLQGFN